MRDRMAVSRRLLNVHGLSGAIIFNLPSVLRTLLQRQTTVVSDK